MCGIYGLFNLLLQNHIKRHTIYDLQQYFRMGSTRGPDNSKFVDYSNLMNAVLGFHRLSINGLSSNSDQPLIINDKILLCNGEIYNYKQLYNKYNIVPKTESDCEVIIHMYERVGFENMIHMLDGVFAFMLIDISDVQNMKLFVTRDPFGVRPLFRATVADNNSNGIFCFTSIMNQLPKNIFTFEQFTPGTWESYMYRKHDQHNIHVWEKNKTVEYFNPYSIQSSNNNYSLLNGNCNNDKFMEYEEIYRTIIYDSLCNAVKKRVDNTDRPIACLLSGGLDSSLITSLVCKYYQRDDRKLETYSIGMEGSEDLEYAKKVAAFLGTDHREIIVSEKDFLRAIPDVIRDIESYDTTTVRASVGNYLVSKYINANSNAKVIFNGDGSDEVTGGYMYFHLAPNEYEFDLECKRLLKDICYFDVLRSDRSISSNGLEARTPFLDKGFVTTYLSIPASIRCHNITGRCEKFLLRSAFANKNVLPDEVLWRTKEAFSDGVSKKTRSWYQIINEALEKGVLYNSKIHYDKVKRKFIMDSYKHNAPKTIEQLYYRLEFDRHYSDNNINTHIIPYFWMPKFVENATDASARTLDIYKQRNPRDSKKFDVNE